MSERPDATATAALGAEVVRPKFLCFLDILGDPVRATTWPASLAMSGTGDDDLDGYTFDALDPALVNISPVKMQDGGSETVTASLSGLIVPDNDLLNVMGDRANWQGRAARLWMGVANADYVDQGAIWHYFTGTMVSLSIRGSATQQIVEVAIETYLAVLTEASNRTYLDQKYFDPDDDSAAAAVAIANGISGAGLNSAVTNGAIPGIGGIGGGLGSIGRLL